MVREMRLLLVLFVALIAAACDSKGAGEGTATVAPSAAAPAKDAAGPAPQPIKPLPAGSVLRVGVTLHPYYSWVKSIAGDVKDVEVRAVLPGDVDAGSYQPRPEDIQKLGDLSAIVVNGIGHDDFIGDMIRASGNASIVVLHANDGTPLVPSAHGGSNNSHTFLSFTNAVQQSYAIARAMGALRPDLAAAFDRNAGEYAKRLRQIQADAAKKLAGAKTRRVVTVHDGYAYLCQELGVEIAGVVEPSHGLVPSAAELGAMVDLIRREKIQVVLTEESFSPKMLDVLKTAGPVRVYVISHVAVGAYSADEFETVMKKNADTLVQALVTDG